MAAPRSRTILDVFNNNVRPYLPTGVNVMVYEECLILVGALEHETVKTLKRMMEDINMGFVANVIAKGPVQHGTWTIHERGQLLFRGTVDNIVIAKLK